MKVLPTGLANHYAQGTTTLAFALKLVRLDGQVFGFTSSTENMIFDGVLYSATQGLSVSSLEFNAGFAVDNLELTTLDDGTLFIKNEVIGGTWRNCGFTILRYNFMDLSDGFETIMVGTVGDLTMKQGVVTVELRGLQAPLQQTIGCVVSATCRARLGDTLCTVDLAPMTFTGSVSTLINRRQFTCSSFVQAENFFTEGSVRFTSGNCSGVVAKIKYSNGVDITLQLPTPTDFLVGDTFTAIAGCQKRFVEDCNGKFSNALNFQGEPHIPGIDGITS